MSELKSYVVWDATTRWFHWINALGITALVAIGLVILNDDALGLSKAGKISLKSIHAWIGYVVTINVLWRIAWAFFGGRYARWKSILPGGKGYLRAVRNYIAGFINGHPEHYLGHNPVGRLAVVALLLLILIQCATGLVLAGTDLFYPPFGSQIAKWVAAPGVAPETLVAYAPDMYHKASYDAMRAFRKPFINVHYYAFYLLLTLALIHVVAVVVTEIRERGNIISAMITGRKILSGPPVDEDEGSPK